MIVYNVNVPLLVCRMVWEGYRSPAALGLPSLPDCKEEGERLVFSVIGHLLARICQKEFRQHKRDHVRFSLTYHELVAMMMVCVILIDKNERNGFHYEAACLRGFGSKLQQLKVNSI